MSTNPDTIIEIGAGDLNADWILTLEQRKAEMALIEEALLRHKLGIPWGKPLPKDAKLPSTPEKPTTP